MYLKKQKEKRNKKTKNDSETIKKLTNIYLGILFFVIKEIKMDLNVIGQGNLANHDNRILFNKRTFNIKKK